MYVGKKHNEKSYLPPFPAGNSAQRCQDPPRQAFLINPRQRARNIAKGKATPVALFVSSLVPLHLRSRDEAQPSLRGEAETVMPPRGTPVPYFFVPSRGAAESPRRSRDHRAATFETRRSRVSEAKPSPFRRGASRGAAETPWRRSRASDAASDADPSRHRRPTPPPMPSPRDVVARRCLRRRALATSSPDAISCGASTPGDPPSSEVVSSSSRRPDTSSSPSPTTFPPNPYGRLPISRRYLLRFFGWRKIMPDKYVAFWNQ